jgi:hypothetical protein
MSHFDILTQEEILSVRSDAAARSLLKIYPESTTKMKRTDRRPKGT